MKIIDVETILLTAPRLSNDPFLPKFRRSAAFIKIKTDSGIYGLGETYAGYFCPECVPPIVEFFKPILIGQTVDDIPKLWARMYQCGNFWCRVGLGTIVLNGIDAALWDLKGKILKQPVHALLGGAKHEKILAYATGATCPVDYNELGRKIDYYLEMGFMAFKVSAHCYQKGLQRENSVEAMSEFEASKVQFMREHVGADIEILMDAHMSNPGGDFPLWDLETAKGIMNAVEPYQLFLFEEPLHYNDMNGYSELRKSSPVPIAGGECTTYSEWPAFIEKECFEIAQLDASYIGSLSSFVDFAKAYEKQGRKIATHNWGGAGSLMQNLHSAFACSNTCILEIPPAMADIHTDFLVDGSLKMENGYVLTPEAPGLGIDLNDDIIEKFSYIPGSGEFNSVPGKVVREFE